MNWYETENMKEVFEALKKGLKVARMNSLGDWCAFEDQRFRIELPTIDMDTVLTEKMEYNPSDNKLSWWYPIKGIIEHGTTVSKRFVAGSKVRYIGHPETVFTVLGEEKPYVDVIPSDDIVGTMRVNVPLRTDLVLSCAINCVYFLGYVWDLHGQEIINDHCVMWRDKAGGLCREWQEGRVKEYCQAVRFERVDK